LIVFLVVGALFFPIVEYFIGHSTKNVHFLCKE
jgi:hypothetical protein